MSKNASMAKTPINRIWIPILTKSVPEVVKFRLPCSRLPDRPQGIFEYPAEHADGQEAGNSRLILYAWNAN